ncbi:MAG: hypothetical protein QM820_32635 [Minicystis sp.]
MPEKTIRITIDYVLDTGERRTLGVDPRAYYDVRDADELPDLDVDSTPRHQEVRQYIPSSLHPHLKAARVQCICDEANDLWEVTESYWSQGGDECIAITVRESRGGADAGWKKFIRIRSEDGRERVLTLIPGTPLPLLDGYVVVKDDTYQGGVQPEQQDTFKSP